MTAGASVLGQDKPKPEAKNDPVAEKKKADKNELPLATKDQLEFETDEVTWISLDVTPDGKTIVFELLGDLYKVPIGGGDATRVTDGTDIRKHEHGALRDEERRTVRRRHARSNLTDAEEDAEVLVVGCGAKSAPDRDKRPASRGPRGSACLQASRLTFHTAFSISHLVFTTS